MTRTRAFDESARAPGRREIGAGLKIADRMPRIVLEARRVAATLTHGAHGRRRAGVGENFWQFRPFGAGEAAHRIDWRRSGRDDRLYVREREWEAAHSVWLWIDRSASMAFGSELARVPKVERAMVLGFVLADVLVEAGERVGLLGAMPARASRKIMERMAEALAADRWSLDDDLAPKAPIGRTDEAILISDFLSPVEEIARTVEAIGGRGARGHLLVVADPVEETFPFEGQAVLEETEDGSSLRVGDAALWGRAYRERMLRHRGALADLARSRGWSFTLHRTDASATQAALRVLTLVAAARSEALGVA